MLIKSSSQLTFKGSTRGWDFERVPESIAYRDNHRIEYRREWLLIWCSCYKHESLLSFDWTHRWDWGGGEYHKSHRNNERDFCTTNPINFVTCVEISVAIKGVPSGRSPGPSGLSYDYLKSTVNICPEIVDDLAFFFNSVIMGRFKLPQALTSSRLVALIKPGGGVRPIAVGESLKRLLAIICFKRVKSSAIYFFRPYQFAIGIPDGTTSAVLCTDLLFNQKFSIENYLLNIDFKNAFNSVFRCSILQELELHYPPLLPYFKLMYGSPSNLIFHSENIVSSRGVKQGDPLGPFFFCLALQSVLVKFKSDFPDIHICAYADDLSLIGPLSLSQYGLQHFVFLFK
ncbi:hypothetical protein P9112_009598 [Eukaryota sp. TZLM1-RC]